MCGIGVFAADTDAEARRLFTSMQMQFLNLRRGQPTPLHPPIGEMDGYWSDAERALVEHALRYAVVGAPQTVRERLRAFVSMTGADELIITAQIYDHAARRRSYQLVAEARDALD
jgi:alkanesulfonate monooxygenase SsuD/methylene tetrahydromethanopterin reductase-like flavin-dependent oxidoreductase (luciferase family)